MTSCRQHLSLALRVLDPPPTGALILTCGWVGTGKSSAARHLAERLPALHLASDVVRKRLVGIHADESLASEWNRGAYSADSRSEIYRALRERAGPALSAGRSVILDATFASRRERDRVRTWAENDGLHPWLIQTLAPDAVTIERLQKRQAEGRDPSDAGPELLPSSRAAFEAPTEWPRDRCIELQTESRDWPLILNEVAARIRAGSFG